MQTFKDKSGQDWTLDLNVGVVTRVRAESDGRFNLYDPHGGELATVLADDLPSLWEVLWFVCSPQIKSRNQTAEDFGRLMADDLLLSAQQKFFAEWRDFFRRCQRAELALIVEKAAMYQAKKMELVKARLDDPLLTTLDQRVETKMQSELSSSFGNLQASLDSILGPLPFGNSPGQPTPEDEKPGKRSPRKQFLSGR